MTLKSIVMKIFTNSGTYDHKFSQSRKSVSSLCLNKMKSNQVPFQTRPPSKGASPPLEGRVSKVLPPVSPASRSIDKDNFCLKQGDRNFRNCLQLLTRVKDRV